MSQNDSPRRITIAEMAPHVHSFKMGENKVTKISDWLRAWINSALKSGKIKPLDFLPSKGSLAFHIGVSLGTIQNVYRIIEDEGLIESKQKIGTYIKSLKTSSEKLTSKREGTCEIIKAYILSNNLQAGTPLGSIRKIASEINIPNTTVRIAINTLINQGIIERQGKDFVIKNIEFSVNDIEQQSLVDKIAAKIEQFIKKNCAEGEKLPSNYSLAEMFNVSAKTIHDAIKLLEGKNLVKIRRGFYGTVVQTSNNFEDESYSYEKIEYKIKKYIIQNAQEGDKLPTIREFAKMFDVSTKTIKKALDNLSDDEYITFTRGRNGGTFVLEVPPAPDKSYTWLAISPDFIQNTDN